MIKELFTEKMVRALVEAGADNEQMSDIKKSLGHAAGMLAQIQVNASKEGLVIFDETFNARQELIARLRDSAELFEEFGF